MGARYDKQVRSLLQASELLDSKNAVLRSLGQAVLSFENLPDPLPPRVATEHLDKILYHCGVYLTSKRPPDDPDRIRFKRWEALNELAAATAKMLGDLAGAKTLAHPEHWKAVGDRSFAQSASYWLERLDPHHRPGHQLSGRYLEWMKSPDDSQPFWAYIGTPSTADDKVTYLMTDVERQAYRIALDPRNRLCDMHDQPYHTKDLETHFSGKGWAIFVCGMDGDLYSHSHHVNHFHHSTFLGGKPVQAAGEIVVDQGQLVCLTAKSGHYRPTPEQIRTFLQAFPGLPDDAVVCPNFSTRSEVYRAGDYRLGGPSARKMIRAQVLAKLPDYARASSSVKNWISEIPEDLAYQQI